MSRLSFVVMAALLSSPAFGDSAVVGNGTAASCTTAAYDAAMQVLVDGPQARGGTLTFRCGPQPHTIAMDREWALTDEVLIDGAGLVTLDGQNAHRFYQAYRLSEGRTAVTLRKIRLIRGFAGDDFGGAVYLHAGTSMTLDGVTIADCRAATSGGAVAADTQTQLDITGSTFLNNRAGNGGALAIRAATQISGSVFTGNRAEAGGGEGGAIQSYEQALAATATVFQDNVSAGNGGALLKRDATVVLDGVSLLRNTAAGNGAGLFATASAGVQGDRVKVIDNVGDGIFAAGSLVLRRTTFQGNRNNGSARTALSIQSGTGALLVEKSTFAGNDNSIFLERAAATPGSPGTLRLDNVTAYGSRFSAVGILDFSRSLDVVIDQSSLIESDSVPLQLFGARITYSGSLIFGAGTSNCAALSTPPGYASGGNNLVGPGCARTGSDGAVQSLAELQLSTLANHGGEVQTLLPAVTSPAIDRRACANVDARDKPRPVDADQDGSTLCDIGAVERQAVELDDRVFADGFDPP